MTYHSVGEVRLRLYPGGIKTRVAWHEVPGKKKKDASSPVGTVDQGFLRMCHFPLSFGPSGTEYTLSLQDFP